MAKKSKNGPHHDLALTVTAVLVITGVMILQMLARKLKRWSEAQKHANDILEASERELSVLGLIAFGLFILETVQAKGEWYQVFHEVHFALFTVALFYVVVNVALYALARHVGRLWREYEAADMQDHWGMTARLHRLRDKLQIPALSHHLLFGSFWMRGLVRHPWAWLEYQHCLEHMTFHEVRRDFLRSHHLPHNFSFATYLESCMQHVCLEFSEIRDTVWFVGILGLLIQLYISTLFSPPKLSTSLTVLGSVVVGLALLIFLKVKWIYWYLLHSEILHNKKESQRTLFWFGNPGLVVTLLEVCLFSLSSGIALLIYKVKKLDDLATPLTLLVVGVVALLYLLPKILPRFTLITHVGEMSDPRRVAAVVRKQQQRGEFEASARDRPNDKKTTKKRPSLQHQPSRLDKVHQSFRETVEDAGISTISALAVVLYVFLVAITLDEPGGRSVLKINVSSIRDAEIALGAAFVVEASVRLWKRFDSTTRRLDLALVLGTVGCNVASFVLRPTSPHRLLHALSALIVLRILNTAWYNELVSPRFHHLRFSADELLRHDTKHFSRSTSSMSLINHASDQQAAISFSLPTGGGPKLARVPSFVTGEKQQQPSWLQFYLAPIEHELGGGLEEEEEEPQVAAVEHRVQQLVRASLRDVGDGGATTTTAEDPDRLAEVALRRALENLLVKDPNAEVKEATDAEDERAGGAATAIATRAQRLEGHVTSTRAEELEDTLYFNYVLLAAVALPSNSRRRAGLFAKAATMIGFTKYPDQEDEQPASFVPHKVKLLLTRDQLVWYDLDGNLSEVNVATGEVVAKAARSLEKPVAIALDVENAFSPLGRVHLSTILRIDARDSDLECFTPSHVVAFTFDDARAPATWKSAILDAIDREDDDDPLHPVTASFRSAGSYTAHDQNDDVERLLHMYATRQTRSASEPRGTSDIELAVTG
ncbi:hypothetical protein CTAYLR_002873 [Chrysophaeum taylorii]|uniref:Uncharacterized protein n=1 Tax=Chrysophaeum taylorii TaxID=2483200 RepID=A0AAD7XIV1_9STRA|nr:hypothetical protein CTAYLR_002873 [Chrysophaeum taylorii]